VGGTDTEGLIMYCDGVGTKNQLAIVTRKWRNDLCESSALNIRNDVGMLCEVIEGSNHDD
jgi:hypothetical protein